MVILTSYRLLIIGLTTALISTSNPESSRKSRRHQRQESTNYVSVAGNLFLTHQQSFGALLHSNGVQNPNLAASEARTNLSFDDDVENMLEHGW